MAEQNLEQSIFMHAIGLAEPTDRAAYLDEACRDNPGLRAELDALLAAHGRLGDVLPPRLAPAATETLTPPPESGTVIGPYKLIEQIGEGGMGTVWMAQQTEPVKRLVALKIIKPGMDSRQVIARFEAERQALALMDHSNIAKVLDAGTTESGRPYFVMELVKGQPITQYCDEHHLTPRQRLELLLPVCQAIQHAHQKGIIHRDIKPTNILVAEYDQKAVPKVIDFGVAKATSQALTEKTMFTGFGQIVGTLEYMSPEQAKVNQLDIDTRSDIYSLGVLLYELLTGSTPFDKQRLRSAAWDEMLRIIREEEPEKPSTRLSHGSPLAPREEGITRSVMPTLASIAAVRGTEPARLSKLVRGELDWIVMKALEKDRSRRYETASSLAADLQHYLNDEPVVACPPSAAYRFRKFARRNKTRLAAASVLAVALLVAVSGIGWTVRDRAARQAEIERERSDRETKLTAQVELILAEVERLEREQKWPEALAAAKRAKTVLAIGTPGSSQSLRVEQAVAELELVARLDEARMAGLALMGSEIDEAAADRAFQRAFTAAGIDMEIVTADEAAAQLAVYSRVAVPLAAGLAEWARCRRIGMKDPEEPLASQLLKVSDVIDPDPWRCRLRAVYRLDRSLRGAAYQDLATEAPVQDLPPLTLNVLGKGLRDNQSPEAGAEFLRHALSTYPDDFILNFDLAGCLGLCRPPQWEESITYFRIALALRPQSAGVRSNLGVALSAQGKLDEAIACHRKAIALDPGFGQAHTNLGHILKVQGKLEEALAEFRKAIEVEPGYALGHYNLGVALRDQGKLDEAIACFRKAIQIEPGYVQAYNNLGNSLDKQGKLEESIACFRKAIEIEPGYAKGHYNLGIALKTQGKFAEAIASTRKAIELKPGDASAHSVLGEILLEQGKLDEALACFRKSIDLDPGDALHHCNLGVTLAKQGKADEAIASFRKASELAPNDARIHRNLGFALFKQAKLDEALASYRRVIELDPNNTDAKSQVGLLLARQGKDQEAIAWARRSVELHPKDPLLLCSLAWHLANADDVGLRSYTEAYDLARQAVELDPKPWTYWNALSVAAYRAGHWQASLEARQQKLSRHPVDAEDLLFQAMAHWQLGSKTEAQQYYDQAATEIAKQKQSSVRLLRLLHESQQLLGIPNAPVPSANNSSLPGPLSPSGSVVP